jgi:hypothetical protein
VFFKQNDRLAPFEWKPEAAVAHYFQGDMPGDYQPFPKPLGGAPLGLSLEKFHASLLDQYLVSRASFAEEEQHHIMPEEQKLVLVIYFYSLFFESGLDEKPIAAFIGKMGSGKSFISTSIGKILFGSLFEPTNFPDSDDSLKTVLVEDRYVVFDNVDFIDFNMQNTLCAYATSRPKMGRRELYKSTQVKGVPRVFMALTSMEPKAWRRDLMRRVLLFNTKKIEVAEDKKVLWAPLLKNRDLIMSEVLANLNDVISILMRYRELSPGTEAGTIAAWAAFALKVTSWFETRSMLRTILHKLAEEKEASVLEEDPLWWVLEYVMFDLGHEEIEPCPTEGLWRSMLEWAEEMKIEKEFRNRVKSAKSLGKHLSQIRDELSKRIVVDRVPGASGRASMWGFRKKAPEAEPTAGKPEAEMSEEKREFLEWEHKYKDDRLPEGIEKVGEERPLNEQETDEAIHGLGIDKLLDEDFQDIIQRLERLEKEKK